MEAALTRFSGRPDTTLGKRKPPRHALALLHLRLGRLTFEMKIRRAAVANSPRLLVGCALQRIG